MPGESAAEMSPLILGEAILRLLSDLGGKGTVLVLEDLQFADPESVAIVEYLADNIASERVLCVATLRDTEPSLAQDMIRAVHARRAATVIDVRGWTQPRSSGWSPLAWLSDPRTSQIIRRLLADSEGCPSRSRRSADAVSSGELIQGMGAGR